MVEDWGDDIGLANSDGEPENHHYFTTEGIPPPEPDGLGPTHFSPGHRQFLPFPRRLHPLLQEQPHLRQALKGTSSASQLPQFGSLQTAANPRPPQYQAPPVLPTQGKASFKRPPHRVFVAEIPGGSKGVLWTPSVQTTLFSKKVLVCIEAFVRTMAMSNQAF